MIVISFFILKYNIQKYLSLQYNTSWNNKKSGGMFVLHVIIKSSLKYLSKHTVQCISALKMSPISKIADENLFRFLC